MSGSAGTGAAGSGGNAGSGGGLSDVCPDYCATIEQVGCSGDAGCTATCVDSFGTTPAQCRAVYAAYLECLSQRDGADFECAEANDKATRKGGVCSSEESGYTGCFTNP